LSTSTTEQTIVSTSSRWRGGRLERANREIRRSLAESRRKSQIEVRKRRCLNAIDECLSKLEELHAKGTRIARREGCRKVVAQLVEKVREDPPEAVQTARNSYDLHAALLNWESLVLDALIPHRRERFSPTLTRSRRTGRSHGADAAGRPTPGHSHPPDV
jgi:hypothetical protein